MSDVFGSVVGSVAGSYAGSYAGSVHAGSVAGDIDMSLNEDTRGKSIGCEAQSKSH